MDVTKYLNHRNFGNTDKVKALEDMLVQFGIRNVRTGTIAIERINKSIRINNNESDFR